MAFVHLFRSMAANAKCQNWFWIKQIQWNGNLSANWNEYSPLTVGLDDVIVVSVARQTGLKSQCFISNVWRHYCWRSCWRWQKASRSTTKYKIDPIPDLPILDIMTSASVAKLWELHKKRVLRWRTNGALMAHKWWPMAHQWRNNGAPMAHQWHNHGTPKAH